MERFFKSVIDQDREAVVICDTNHTIIYMNPAAVKRYHKDLTGASLLNCHNEKSNEMIQKVVDWFAQGVGNNMICLYKNPKKNEDVYMVALRNETGELIGYYEKHESRNPETAGIYDFSKSLI